MADTTLNVRVVNNGTGGAGGTTPPVTPPNTPPSPQPPQQPIPPTNDRGNGLLPSNDRMIEDVRREMQQRGVLMVPGSSSMSQIINQYGANLRTQQTQGIRSEYSALRQSNLQERDELLRQLEERKRQNMELAGLNPDDTRDVNRYRGTQGYQNYLSEHNRINRE